MAEYDASDVEHVRERQKKAKDKDLEREEGLRQIMNTRQGRAWMHDLLSGCGIWRISFNENPYQTAFAEGSRNVGLPIIVELAQKFPDQYTTMIKESEE